MTFKVTKRDATVHEAFVGDGYYDLSLTIERLIQLEELCGNVGPAVILARLKSATYKVGDVRETIRLGLIGADMDQEKASNLVRDYVTSGYLAQYVGLAIVTIQCALLGPEDDPVGESPAATEEVTTDQQNGQPSTISPEPQATRRRKSTK